MKLTPVKKFAVTALLLPLLLMMVFILLYRFTPVVDRAIEDFINHLGKDKFSVSYGEISGNLLGTFRLSDLTVAFSGDTLRSERLDVNYSLIDVLRSRYYLRTLHLVNPYLRMDIGGDANADTVSTPIDTLIRRMNLEAIPLIAVDQLRIDNGRVDLFSGPQLREAFDALNTTLAFRMADDTVLVNPHSFNGRWRNRDISLTDLALDLRGNKRHMTVDQLRVQLDNEYLYGSGRVQLLPRFEFDARIDTSRITLTLLKKFITDLPYQEGEARIFGSAGGRPDSINGAVRVAARMDQLSIQQLKFDFQLSNDLYALSNMRLRSNFLRAAGRATISADGENRFLVAFRDLDLNKLGMAGDTAKVSGKFSAEFRNWDLSALAGKGDITLYDLRVADYRLDSLICTVTAAGGRIELRKPSRLVIAERSRFILRGRITDGERLDINLESKKNDLAALAGRFGVEDAHGTGDMDLRVWGALESPSVEGTLFLDSLGYQNNMVYAVDGNLKVEDLSTDRRGFFDLEVATGYMGDIFLTSGEVKLVIDGNRVQFSPVAFYSEENSITTMGEVLFAPDVISMGINDFRLNYNKNRIESRAPFNLQFAGDSIVVSQLNLRADSSGYVTGKGVLSPEGNSRFDAEIANIPLGIINQYIKLDYTLDGTVAAQLELDGPLSSPEVLINLNLENLLLDDRPLGFLQGEFTYREDQFGINYVNYEGSDGSYLSVNGSVDLNFTEQGGFAETPLALNVVFGDFQLGDYVTLFQPDVSLGGKITGRIDLNGSIRRPQIAYQLNGDVLHFETYELRNAQLSGGADATRFFIDSGMLNYASTIVEFSGEKSLTWDPQHPDSIMKDKQFLLHVKIREDSLNFLGAFNENVERITGKIQLDATLAGDYDAPQLRRSDFTIEKGTIQLTKLENPIRDVDCAGHLEGTRLVFDRLSARSPEINQSRSFFRSWWSSLQGLFIKRKPSGFIVGRGSIDIAHLDRPKYDLAVTLKDAYFDYFLEKTRVVVSSENLTVTGRDTLLIAGDVLVSKGEVLLDFAESEKNLLLVKNVRETPPLLSMDLDLNILPNFYITSQDPFNAFNIRLSGDLRVTQDARALPEYYGSLEASGKYIIQGEDFDIQNGKINFVNPKDLPEVNLFAIKQKGDKLFNLNIHGTLDAPEKEITIQDENGNTIPVQDTKDQLALLLFGVSFDQIGSDADNILLSKGEQVVTQAVISRIESEARAFTGFDHIRLDSQEGFFRNRLNSSAGTTLALGKYLTPKLYLEYRAQLASAGLGNVPSPQLSWEGGNQIYLKYRFNNQWAFTTAFQKNQQGEEKVRVDISWRLGF